MIRLIARWVRDFLWSEKTARASLRSFIAFLSAELIFIFASATDATGHVNYEIIRQWDLSAWLVRFVGGFGVGLAARIPVGEKNPTAEEIAAAAKGEAKP